MRIAELRAQICSQNYRVDPHAVAEAMLALSESDERGVNGRSGARSPAGALPPRPDR